MEKIKNILIKIKSNKVLLTIAIIGIVASPFILINLLSKTQQRNPLTIPVIPPTPTISRGPIEPLDTVNPHNPEQELVFNWGSLSPNIPSTMSNASVGIPLVNPTSITFAANKLGFTNLDQSPNSDEGTFHWTNPKAGLFGSPRQNQIFFNSKETLPENTNVVSQEQAISIASGLITTLFGDTLSGTLESNPEVKYLLFSQTVGEDEPEEVVPEKANLINVNFRQHISGLPIINLSKKGETISVAFDTTGKLFLIYVYGGFMQITQEGQSDIMSFSQLTQTANLKAIRISYAADIPAETAYTNAGLISIKVGSVNIGYFQREDNSLFPVFIIEGIMSAQGLTPYPATYIVPATEN